MHRERPGGVEGPRLVLSRLPRGESIISRASMSVKLVLEGEESYVCGGRNYRLRAGEMLLVSASNETMIAQIRKGDGAGVCVYFSEGDFEIPAAAHDILLDGPVTLSAAGSPLVEQMRSVGRKVASAPDAGPAVANAAVASAGEWLRGLLGSPASPFAGATAARPATRRELIRRAELSRGYLHAIQDRHVPLHELAAYANTSPFHLSRVFTQFYGVPPAAYHRDLRLDGIAARLRTEKLNLSRAAADLGYSDQAAFTKAFKRRFGMPPGEWMRGAKAA